MSLSDNSGISVISVSISESRMLTNVYGACVCFCWLYFLLLLVLFCLLFCMSGVYIYVCVCVCVFFFKLDARHCWVLILLYSFTWCWDVFWCLVKALGIRLIFSRSALKTYCAWSRTVFSLGLNYPLLKWHLSEDCSSVSWKHFGWWKHKQFPSPHLALLASLSF